MFTLTNLYFFSLPVYIYSLLRFLICPFKRMSDYLVGARKIADIGCGHGLFTLYCGIHNPDAEIIGFEPDEKRIKFGIRAGKKVTNVKFKCGEFEYVKNVDAVCLSDVLHHIDRDNQEILIKKISDMLPSGGKLLIKEICTNDNLKYLISSLSDKILYPHDNITFRSKEQWCDLLEKSDFSVIHYRDWMSPVSTNLFIAEKK